MSEKILYLHVGTPKTATTTIQKFFHYNHEILKQKGVCYPILPFTYPPKAKSRNGLFLGTPYTNPDGIRDPKVESERFDTGLNAIHEAFETCDKVLLSDESLFTNLYKDDCKILKRLYEDSISNDYTIHILVYLRRQDKFIESFWNQRVKAFSRLTTEFKDYACDAYTLDYCAVLKRFESVIGRDALTVHRFEDLTSGDGVLDNFLSELGLTLTDDFIIITEPANTGLSGNATTIKLAANKMQNISTAENYFIRDSLLELSASSKELYKCSEFSVDERTEFMRNYEEGNRYISENYIHDGKPLFSEDYSGPEKRTTDNPEYINDIIRGSYYSDILLHRKITALEDKVKEYERKIKANERKMNDLERKFNKLETRVSNLRHPVKAVIKKMTSSNN